ncbi:hypothetical protein [Paenibacillus sp. FSL H8-0537]|uniref:hypothetical protein n=1 Tax=Paenibacillus sp. FSL H8-0537 TaxID=2921399 RepID=UPI003100AE21
MATETNNISGDKPVQEHVERNWTANQMQYSDVQRVQKGETVYLTANDFTLTSQYLYDSSVHYFIHADTIHLAGKLEVKGRNIIINARMISSDGEVIIDTSADKTIRVDDFKPGAILVEKSQGLGEHGNSGSNGRNGGQGPSAGSISLAAEKFNLGGQLKLIANGGNGGRGQDGGGGGEGAEGSEGADGKAGFSAEDAAVGGNGGHGGNGGDAGKSGNGGHGGTIFVGYVIPSKEHFITMESKGGLAGELATPGKGNVGGKGGIGGRKLRLPPAMEENKDFWNSLPLPAFSKYILGNERESSGKEGKVGKDGQPAVPASDGQPGLCGIKNDGQPAAIQYKHFYGAVEAAQLLESSPHVDHLEPELQPIRLMDQRLFGTLEQKTLTLHTAGIAYLAGNEDKIEESATLLDWLLKTLPDAAWFDKLQYVMEQEELKTEHDEESKSFIHFGKQMQSTSLQWLVLRNKTSLLVAQLSQGLDYFGHPWNWVPLMPLDRYLLLGNNLITAAQQSEDLYKDYLRFQSSQDSRVAIIKKALDTSIKKYKEIENRREELVNEREKLKRDIDTKLADVKSKGEALQKTATDFVEALRRELRLDSLKLTVELIITGVALATGAAPVVVALKSGGAIASAISNLGNEGKATVINEGDKSDRARAIKKEKKEQEKELSKALGNVKKTAAAGYALYKQGGGLIDLSNQIDGAKKAFGYNSTLIAMSREEFEEMLAPVYSKVPNAAGQYRKDFNEFLNVVEDYQSKVLAYNGLYLEDQRLATELIRIHAEDERLRQRLGDNDDESLQLFHSFIYDLYSQAKLALIDFLYQEYQAYRYMVLSNVRFPEIKGSHVAELSMAHAEITSQLTKALNASEGPTQPFTDIKFIFNEDNFPEQFQALREGKAAVFSISLNNQIIREKIAGKAHLVVSDCSIELPGARLSQGDVHVQYTHSGSTAFLDRYAKRHDFIHNSTLGFYEYEVSFQKGRGAGGMVEKYKPKAGGVVGDDKNRILPGLLSVWSIKVPTIDLANMPMNEGVNLDNVKKIEMTLKGKSEAYSDKAPNNRLRAFELPAKPIQTVPDHDLFAVTNVHEQADECIVIEL